MKRTLLLVLSFTLAAWGAEVSTPSADQERQRKMATLLESLEQQSANEEQIRHEVAFDDEVDHDDHGEMAGGSGIAIQSGPIFLTELGEAEHPTVQPAPEQERQRKMATLLESLEEQSEKEEIASSDDTSLAFATFHAVDELGCAHGPTELDSEVRQIGMKMEGGSFHFDDLDLDASETGTLQAAAPDSSTNPKRATIAVFLAPTVLLGFGMLVLLRVRRNG